MFIINASRHAKFNLSYEESKKGNPRAELCDFFESAINHVKLSTKWANVRNSGLLRVLIARIDLY